MSDFYLSGNKLYVKDGDIYRNVGISAKDKVVTTRKLESTTVVRGEVILLDLKNAMPVSLSEAIAKFAISEMNPLLCEKVDRTEVPNEEASELHIAGKEAATAAESKTVAVVPPVVPVKKPAQKRPGARK